MNLLLNCIIIMLAYFIIVNRWIFIILFNCYNHSSITLSFRQINIPNNKTNPFTVVPKIKLLRLPKGTYKLFYTHPIFLFYDIY